MLEQGDARGLLAFGAADNHLHAELVTDRATAGMFAAYVATSLRWKLALPVAFEPARVRPLADQRHAYNAFRYVQRQDEHHDVDRDPMREATSLPDLLGLRVLPTRIAARVRRHLPRLTRGSLLALLPGAGAGATARAAPSAADLVEGAKAAFALPDLRGRSEEVHRARCAAVHAAGPTVRLGDFADALAVTKRTVQALRTHPTPAAATQAVAGQARLRAWLNERAGSVDR